LQGSVSKKRVPFDTCLVATLSRDIDTSGHLVAAPKGD